VLAVSLGRTGWVHAVAGGRLLRSGLLRGLILALGLVGTDAQAAKVVGDAVGELFEERHDGECKRGQKCWRNWQLMRKVCEA
jgi:hypothetical protein